MVFPMRALLQTITRLHALLLAKAIPKCDPSGGPGWRPCNPWNGKTTMCKAVPALASDRASHQNGRHGWSVRSPRRITYLVRYKHIVTQMALSLRPWSIVWRLTTTILSMFIIIVLCVFIVFGPRLFGCRLLKNNHIFEFLGQIKVYILNLMTQFLLKKIN